MTVELATVPTIAVELQLGARSLQVYLNTMENAPKPVGRLRGEKRGPGLNLWNRSEVVSFIQGRNRGLGQRKRRGAA